jgi:hypothetical protein
MIFWSKIFVRNSTKTERAKDLDWIIQFSVPTEFDGCQQTKRNDAIKKIGEATEGSILQNSIWAEKFSAKFFILKFRTHFHPKKTTDKFI